MIIDNTKLLYEIEQGLLAVQELIKNDVVMEMFTKDFSFRFCWSSNAIEGNTLSLDETIDLIEYDEVRAGKPYSHYQDAKNLYRAISESMLPFHPELITKAWIKKNNGIIMGTDGEYRTKKVFVGSLVEVSYLPPDPEQVHGLMEKHLQTVNFEATTIAEIIEKVAQLHFSFERIHPFNDGNGRVGRMILNQQLINHGLLPVTIGPKGDYRRSFKLYDKNGDMSKLIHEICKEELKAIERVKELGQKLKHPGLDEQLTAAEQKKTNKEGPLQQDTRRERKDEGARKSPQR